MSEILTLAETFKHKSNKTAQTIEQEVENVTVKLNKSMIAKLQESELIIKKGTESLGKQTDQLQQNLQEVNNELEQTVRSYSEQLHKTLNNHNDYTQQMLDKTISQLQESLTQRIKSIDTLVDQSLHQVQLQTQQMLEESNEQTQKLIASQTERILDTVTRREKNITTVLQSNRGLIIAGIGVFIILLIGTMWGALLTKKLTKPTIIQQIMPQTQAEIDYSS